MTETGKLDLKALERFGKPLMNGPVGGSETALLPFDAGWTWQG